MSKRIRLSSDALTEASKEHYRGEGWSVPVSFPKDVEAFVSTLQRRPDFMATNDGMEHLVFATGRVSDTTIAFQKQVLFDIDRKPRHSHIVLVCEEPVPRTRESEVRELGVGVLLIRLDVPPLLLVRAKLRGFRPRQDLESVPARIRPKVKDALRRVSEENVCVAILDLVQIVELEMDRLVPATKDRPFGAKIHEAESKGKLSDLAIKAARRINVPRIRRAHPKTHAQRRKHIVDDVQSIVDDCLAMLFALG
ncbi:MAG: hypothetical protein HZA46_13695 [Planctomycetales bacterium]|nr:hypothetical protein [Planctomycetales bacterium]